ncbi:LysR family transcriptional regulator [Paraburkholderia sp. ZP32-5]|uniref:LysR family transcriptional regulator n=1 Tax=Paraburkholderia sp. ZP32-5 TaxID=2883245 RepID=UPI001F460422|nr:LysR family transcriptional regulator [Paraburkholderia sp. ZP32-5]
MKPSVTFRQLNAFRTVARLQSFTQAANALHISQSALTMQIGALENQLGVQLFDRSRRQVSLTFVGDNLLALAARIVDEVDGFAAAASELAGLDRGIVRVATLPSIASRYVAPAARALKREFPGFQLKILDAVAERVIELVKEGDADFGITSRVAGDPDLHWEYFLEDRLFGYEHVATAGDPPRTSITLAELASKPLILSGRNGIVRKLLDQAISDHGLDMRADYEVVYDATAISLAKEGLGIAVLSEAIGRTMQAPELAAYPIVDPEIRREVWFVWSNRQTLSRSANALRLILLNGVERERQEGGVSGADSGEEPGDDTDADADVRAD